MFPYTRACWLIANMIVNRFNSSFSYYSSVSMPKLCKNRLLCSYLRQPDFFVDIQPIHNNQIVNTFASRLATTFLLAMSRLLSFFVLVSRIVCSNFAPWMYFYFIFSMPTFTIRLITLLLLQEFCQILALNWQRRFNFSLFVLQAVLWICSWVFPHHSKTCVPHQTSRI